jgi:hypothetical protein
MSFEKENPRSLYFVKRYEGDLFHTHIFEVSKRISFGCRPTCNECGSYNVVHETECEIDTYFFYCRNCSPFSDSDDDSDEEVQEQPPNA